MQTVTGKSEAEWTAMRRVVVGVMAVITVIALFYAEEDLRGRMAWHSYQRSAQAKGIILDSHALEPAPVADDENFAMTPFLAPLLDYTVTASPAGTAIWRDPAGHDRAINFAMDVGAVNESMRNSSQNPKSPEIDILGFARELQKKSKTMPQEEIGSSREAARVLLNYFGQYGAVMDEMREASKRPYSRFNVHYDDPDPTRVLLPHLAVLRRMDYVLFYRGAAELELGGNDAAYNDLILLIKMANSIRTEPFMISQLVRVAMLNHVQHVVWVGLAQRAWSAEQLKQLQGELESVTVLEDGKRGLQYEHAGHGNAIFDVVRSKPALLVEDLGWGPAAAWAMRLMPSGWSYLEQVSYNRIYDETILGPATEAATRVSPHEINEAANHVQKLVHVSPMVAILHHRIAAAILLPATEHYFQRMAFCATQMNEAAIACALERYRVAHGGQFPGTLEALSPDFMKVVPNDVITGEPLKYRSGDREFVLYSVGWNEKDDNGQGEFQGGSRRDFAKGDWIWPEYSSK